MFTSDTRLSFGPTAVQQFRRLKDTQNLSTNQTPIIGVK